MRFQLCWSILALVVSFVSAQNASSILSLLESTTTCAGCEVVLLALKTLALLGDDAFVNTITTVCVLAHLEDEDVCKGAIASEGPIIAHDLRGMIIPSHTAQTFCTSLLGLCPYPNVRPYQVKFPKPKPNATRPASSGQPPLQVVHFSDIHIDLDYETGSNYNCTKPICCRPYTAADAPGNTSYPAGPHGNHQCDTPESLEQSMYNAIEQFAPDASFGLFTGDIPDHAIWLVDRPDVTNDIQTAYAKMASRLGMPIYATAGNHEAAPVNSFPPAGIIGASSSQWVYDALSTAWTQWIGPTAAAQADSYGAYSYKRPGSNLRIISIDTNFYYSVNFWLYELRIRYDPNGQLAWLVNELQRAEDAGERVYIIGHMPFGVGDALPDGSNYLNQIVNRYEATIAAMFFGMDISPATSGDYTN
jgi:sphingomyelin phosphodiesterase